MKQTFYSNGKLLITSEYLVLDGATALALPTKMGQYLNVEPGNKKVVFWKSFDFDGSIWFETKIDFIEIVNFKKNKIDNIRNTLLKILHEAFLLQPNFIKNANGYTITTQLTFPKKWGLGTSSTLLNNIAQWLQINAFTLLKNSFGGSGYDIACAQNNKPILYQWNSEKPKIQEINFNPLFKNHLYFVYLNKKQSSKAGIVWYEKQKTKINLPENIFQINKITENICEAKDLEKFIFEILEHEKKIAQILQMPTVKSNIFPFFNGAIKSLGAWGGDFVLIASSQNPTNYFKSKGYETILTYNEMILK